MFRNYLLTTIRHLSRHRIFSIMNIAGLSVGIAACLFITTWVHYERSYDRDIRNVDQLYRVLYERVSESGEKVQFASASPMIGLEMKKRFPEVMEFGRAFRVEGTLKAEDESFSEENMFWADPSFPVLLSFEVRESDGDSLLSEPNTALISESIARKYYGDGNPVGRTFQRDGKETFRVVGVFRDLPPNRHFKADILLSWINLEKQLGENIKTFGWIYSGFYNYVRLRPGTDPKVIDGKIRRMIEDELGDFMARYKLKIHYRLQPVTDIHLTSHFMHELGDNGNQNSVRFLYIIAWFIILIAWINFVNLLSVSFIRRWGEISLRKVMGARIRDLIGQFITESLVVNTGALLLALALFESLYPVFSNLTGVPAGYEAWRQDWFLQTLGIIFFAGILLAGSVPVWGILNRKLAASLRTTFTGSRRAVLLRKVLLGFQFFMAIILIAGTISVYLQLQFMHQKETGNDKTGIIVMKVPRVGGKDLLSLRESFKKEIEKKSFVRAIAFSSVIPGKSNMFNRGGIIRKGQDPNEGNNYRVTEADDHYMDVYSNVLLAGRNFDESRPADKEAVIVNLTACKLLGFNNPEDAVGERIIIPGQENTIIGVIQNFHQESPRTDFEPQIFRIAQRHSGYFSLKPESLANKKQMIAVLRKEFETYFPGNPFDYFFLEDYYNRQYRPEVRFGQVFGIFSVLALIITLLGILSLSAISAAQRSREIGIRKVHGASVRQILGLLSLNYIVLLVVAYVVSIPVIYHALQKWLSNFANRMDLSPLIFVVPVVTVSLFSLIMVLIQSRRAAGRNPAETLSYE